MVEDVGGEAVDQRSLTIVYGLFSIVYCPPAATAPRAAGFVSRTPHLTLTARNTAYSLPHKSGAWATSSGPAQKIPIYVRTCPSLTKSRHTTLFQNTLASTALWYSIRAHHFHIFIPRRTLVSASQYFASKTITTSRTRI